MFLHFLLKKASDESHVLYTLTVSALDAFCINAYKDAFRRFLRMVCHNGATRLDGG